MVSAPFLSINTLASEAKGIKLQEITLDGDVAVDGSIMIQLLTNNGYTRDTYRWIDNRQDLINQGVPEQFWEDAGLMHGWYLNGMTKTDVTFEPGQGLWVTGLSENTKLQINGQVYNADTVVDLTDGAVATGNPFPVPLALQDIAVQVDTVKYPNATIAVDGSIMIQLLTNNGYTRDTYRWIDNRQDLINQGVPEQFWEDAGLMHGWYLNGMTKSDISFDPGQGLWVTGTMDGQQLFFPGISLSVE